MLVQKLRFDALACAPLLGLACTGNGAWTSRVVGLVRSKRGAISLPIIAFSICEYGWGVCGVGRITPEKLKAQFK